MKKQPIKKLTPEQAILLLEVKLQVPSEQVPNRNDIYRQLEKAGYVDDKWHISKDGDTLIEKLLSNTYPQDPEAVAVVLAKTGTQLLSVRTVCMTHLNDIEAMSAPTIALRVKFLKWLMERFQDMSAPIDPDAEYRVFLDENKTRKQREGEYE